MATKATEIQHSLRPMLLELERVYLETAQRSGNGLVRTHPLITVQTRGTRKTALGWCAHKRWTHGKGDVTEISISAETLKSRTMLEVLSTLVHEMAHYANELAGVKDCSAGGRHNKRFKETAESLGLIVAPPDKSKGHAFTQAGEELAEFLNGLEVSQEAFDYARKAAEARSKSPTRMLKWSCGCTIVRAVRMNADCEDCGGHFDADLSLPGFTASVWFKPQQARREAED